VQCGCSRAKILLSSNCYALLLYSHRYALSCSETNGQELDKKVEKFARVHSWGYGVCEICK
jgi:hypothetical protein